MLLASNLALSRQTSSRVLWMLLLRRCAPTCALHALLPTISVICASTPLAAGAALTEPASMASVLSEAQAPMSAWVDLVSAPALARAIALLTLLAVIPPGPPPALGAISHTPALIATWCLASASLKFLRVPASVLRVAVPTLQETEPVARVNTISSECAARYTLGP